MATDLADASIKMFGSLALILGLIICVFYVLRRLRFGAGHPGRYPRMRLLGSLAVAPKRSVALVEVCDEWFLVGIGTESVTLISKMDRLMENNGRDADDGDPKKHFLSLLQKKQSAAKTQNSG